MPRKDDIADAVFVGRQSHAKGQGGVENQKLQTFLSVDLHRLSRKMARSPLTSAVFAQTLVLQPHYPTSTSIIS